MLTNHRRMWLDIHMKNATKRKAPIGIGIVFSTEGDTIEVGTLLGFTTVNGHTTAAIGLADGTVTARSINRIHID